MLEDTTENTRSTMPRSQCARGTSFRSCCHDETLNCAILVYHASVFSLVSCFTPLFPQLSSSYSQRALGVKAPKEQYRVVLREDLTVKKLAEKLNVGTGRL